MSQLEILAVVALLILRLGVPLAITLAFAYALRRLDVRWQAKAIKPQKSPIQPLLQEPCWVQKGCDLSRRARCPAFQHSDFPCWTARRLREGQLPVECYTCKRFSPGQVAYGSAS